MARNQLGITWGPEGVLQLRDDQNVQIQAMEEASVCNASLTANITIPSRSLAAVTVKMILPSCQNKTRFNFAPTTLKAMLGPNCVIYPLDYATIKGGLQRGVQIVVNLGCQEIRLPEGMVLGRFQQMPDEEIKVMLNIGIVSNETNTDVRMYNLILLDDLHYSMYK